MGWQPIETAPKDRDILAGNGLLIMLARIFYMSLFVTAKHGGGHDIDPTHWMPLPEPPPPTGDA